jgi:hypothetical protein
MAYFLYVVEGKKSITKLFTEAQVKAAFRRSNTIQNVVISHPQSDKYVLEKWHIPNEMYGLSAEIHRRDGQNVSYYT